MKARRFGERNWRSEPSSPPGVLARLEERKKRCDIAPVRPQLDEIDTVAPKGPLERRVERDRTTAKSCADNGVRAIDRARPAGLWIAQRQQSHRGQLALTRVDEVQRDHVVSLRQRLECGPVTRGHPVRDHEYHGTPAEHTVRELERRPELRARPARLEREQLSNDAERVSLPTFGGDELLDAIGEKHRTDAVIVAVS